MTRTQSSRFRPALRVILAAAAFACAAPSLLAATDVLTVGTVTAPKGTILVPVYVRDVGTTRLGSDRPVGERIQAVGFKISFAPSGLVTSATFTRAGALLKTPLFETTLNPPGSGSIGFVASFAEATNPLAFPLDAAAPGTLIGYISVSLSSAATAGNIITLTIDPATAILSNQAGTITETYANTGLTLQNGSITIAAGTCPALAPTTSLSGIAGACTLSTGGTATVTGGSGDWIYQWGWRNVSGGSITPIASATSASYTIAGADFDGAGVKYLVATVRSSCAGPVVTNEIPIEITTAPIVTISASSGVFASSTSNFASVADQGAGATYTWSITNGTITSGQGTRSIRYTAGSSGSVTLGVSVTKNGCGDPANPSVQVPILTQAAGASMLYLVTPCRVIDTRGPVGTYGGPMAASGSQRQIPITGACGIPAGAKSIAANITAIAPATTGYLALFPSDMAWSGTSTVNYRTGRTRANNAIIRLSSDGRLTVKNEGSALHYIIDVTGYFQ